MRIIDLVKELTTLALIGSSRSYAQPKVEKIAYEIEPLPWYYIDYLDIGDFIVYKVSTNNALPSHGVKPT